MHLYYDIPMQLKFNGNDLNNALRKDPAMKNDIKRDQKLPNVYGIYHDHYKPVGQNIHCYYACKPGEEYVHAPPTGNKWYDSIASIPELQKECEAIARSTRKLREFPHDVIDIVSRARHLEEQERPTKRTRLDEDTDNASRLSSLVPSTETSKKSLPLEVVGVAPPESLQPAVQKLPAGTNIYWDSADARKLFGASDNETYPLTDLMI
jgi:hypothetical protein